MKITHLLAAGALVAGLCSYQPAHALDLSDDDLLIEMDGAEFDAEQRAMDAEDRDERMMQRLDELEFNNEMRHRELMDRLDELPE